MITSINIHRVKLLAIILFFTILLAPVLRAESPTLHNSHHEIGEFEITAAFISSWKVVEVRDYAVIEVLVTSEFVEAHQVVEELRKFINEPILVKTGFANDKVSYEIIVGRFNNVDEASDYHNLLM